MKFFKSKISIFIIGLIFVFIICIIGTIMRNINSNTPQIVGTKEKLEDIYNNPGEYLLYNILYTFCFPFNRDGLYKYPGYLEFEESSDGMQPMLTYYSLKKAEANNSSIDHTPSVFVDEPERKKYDGKYIYDFSDNYINIYEADGLIPGDLISSITIDNGYTPKELLLYKDKLVVNLNEIKTSLMPSFSHQKEEVVGTKIIIYDLTDRYNPIEEKNIETDSEKAYLKIIDGKLYYVFCDKINELSNDMLALQYTEDGIKKEIDLNNTYYFKNDTSRFFTAIAWLDLEEKASNFNIKSYLIYTSNVYFTDYNIYLQYVISKPKNYIYASIKNRISKLFSLEGVNGNYHSYSYDTESETYAVKLVIDRQGNVQYVDNKKYDVEFTENIKSYRKISIFKEVQNDKGN